MALLVGEADLSGRDGFLPGEGDFYELPGRQVLCDEVSDDGRNTDSESGEGDEQVNI